MLKSIFYKEWLKIGKTLILLCLIGLLMIAGIYLSVRHDLVVNDPSAMWDRIVNHRYIYFSIFQFFPLISGLLIGIAQFLPEITDKRIKLTLHLPLDEEEVVLTMVALGATAVASQYLVLLLAFFGWGLVFFPWEIMCLSVFTVLPWLLAGVAAYFLTGFILLEPLWRYRITYIAFATAFISLFFKSQVAGAYEPALWYFVSFVLMISISSMLSIYRFRKGEM